MARIVEFPKRPPSPHLRGRTEKYPFDEWFDGKAYLLVQGEDFQNKVSSMRTNLISAAKRRGIKIRTVLTPEGIAVQKKAEPNGALPAIVVEAPVAVEPAAQEEAQVEANSEEW